MLYYEPIDDSSDPYFPGLDFFRITLHENVEWLRIRHYDLASKCRFSSTLHLQLPPHRLSITGLTENLTRTIDVLSYDTGVIRIPPDTDLPVVTYVIRDATYYRDCGFTLTDYMAGLKCFRKTYLGFALESLVDKTKDIFLEILAECFDRCEVALCELWQNLPDALVRIPTRPDRLDLPEGDRFKILFENLPEPTILIDKNFVVSGLNIAAAEALGMSSTAPHSATSIFPGICTDKAKSRNDLIGRAIGSIMPWLRETILTFQQTSGDLFTTTISITEGSVTMWVDITVSRLLALMDKCEGAVVRIRDISGNLRKKAQNRRDEQLYQALQGTTDSVWEYDLRSNQIHFSSSFYTMLGYQPFEFEPSLARWKELLHPSDLQVVKGELQHTTQTGLPINLEARIQTKSGEWKWIHGRGKVVERDEEDRPVRLSGSALDISSRREAEKNLGRSERFFKGVFEDAAVGVALIAPDGTISTANTRCSDLTGFSQEELTGSTIDRFYHPDEISQVQTNMQALFLGKADTFRSERRIIRKDGSSLYVDQSTSVIRNENGTVASLIAVLIDTTERMRSEKELVINERVMRRYQELMKVILNGVPALIGYIDTDLRYKFVNDYYEKLHGTPPELVIGKRVPDLLGEEVFDKVKHHYKRALRGEDVRYELLFDSELLGKRHLEINYLPHCFDGVLEGIIILIIDSTKQKRVEQQRDKFFDVSLDMFSVVEFDGSIRQINPAWTRLLGWNAEELKGTKLINLVHPRDKRTSYNRFMELTKGVNLLSFENRVRSKDGTYRWVTWNSLPLPQERLIYSVAHDTTHRREIEEQLRTMASIDPLTKIINRRHFFELGNVEFAKAKRHSHQLSVFMLDIDHFKTINDTYGHLAGDQVLRELAVVCQDILRETDLFGRFGGEEFAGVLIEVDQEGAISTVTRILHGISSHLVKTDAGEISFTASIGTATLSSSDETLQHLLNRADTALYKAKRGGRNCVVHA
ncbi:MAG: PAS domain S-box protein [Desulforhopalus sp.]